MISILIKPNLLAAVLDQSAESGIESASRLLMRSTETDNFLITPLTATRAIESIFDGNFFLDPEWCEVCLADTDDSTFHPTDRSPDRRIEALERLITVLEWSKLSMTIKLCMIHNAVNDLLRSSCEIITIQT